MPSTETSPEPGLHRVESSGSHGAEAEEAATEESPEAPGLVRLLKDLADDTRTLVQQEIELARLEVAQSTKRIAVDGGWIWAGAVVLTVGLICLALALALGLGALLDSYWLGALITGAVFLLIGALLAWRGIRDLTSGGLLPTNPLESLQEDRDWAKRELDELKQGITEET
ncbi:MAG: phage holin family protein [Longimicrobiales bacterium]